MSDFSGIHSSVRELSKFYPKTTEAASNLLLALEKLEQASNELQSTKELHPADPRRINAVERMENWLALTTQQLRGFLQSSLLHFGEDVKKAMKASDKLLEEIKQFTDKESKDG